MAYCDGPSPEYMPSARIQDLYRLGQGIRYVAYCDRGPSPGYPKTASRIVADLQKLAPHIDWQATFAQMGIKTDTIDVAQPAYYTALSTLLVSEPINVWKEKVKFDYIASKAPLLSTAFRNEDFKFDQIFSGEKNQKERCKDVS